MDLLAKAPGVDGKVPHASHQTDQDVITAGHIAPVPALVFISKDKDSTVILPIGDNGQPIIVRKRKCQLNAKAGPSHLPVTLQKVLANI